MQSKFRSVLLEQSCVVCCCVLPLMVAAIQRKGLGFGSRMMEVVERIAQNGGLRKVVLTCFKHNDIAMSFYLDKLMYEVDETSPSKWTHVDPSNANVDYEILSKRIELVQDKVEAGKTTSTETSNTSSHNAKKSGKKKKKGRR